MLILVYKNFPTYYHRLIIELGTKCSIAIGLPVAAANRMSGARVEPAPVDPDDDRESVRAVVDAGVG